MIRAATKAIISSWTDPEESYGINLSLDVERHLLSLQHDCDDEANHDVHMVERLRQEDPQVLALTRNRFPAEPPVGRKLELIRQQMLRVHRASGHSSFQNLSVCWGHGRHQNGPLIWPDNLSAQPAKKPKESDLHRCLH